MRRSFSLRDRFVNYFKDHHGHQVVRSSPLIPQDESLLFTNAGMVQFKDRFLGKEQAGGLGRVASVQKCVRAGGKHNDLENVGFTPRHHTFFEMLGNFSFGDYFKEEAIVMAWQFVHKELEIPADRLRVTIFEQDDESEALWNKVLPSNGVVPIERLGMEDNFWSMGNGVGLPCGPCSEIFFRDDKGNYLEIWNLVFMQFLSTETDGVFQDLPRPCVDTGMGLERLASVMQGVESNFETDLLAPLVEQAKLLTKGSVFPSRVIADHIRAAAFLIADGVIPSNVGRGYVLRRIIRRACGFGHQAGIRDPFLTTLLDTLETTFKDENGVSCYPELQERRDVIHAIIQAEEDIFFRMVGSGMEMLNSHIALGKPLDGDFVFKLYDSYGFPLDLTCAVAREKSLEVDIQGFERNMEEQRKRSCASGNWSQDQTGIRTWEGQCTFVGYDKTHHDMARVVACHSCAEEEEEGGRFWIAIEPCPFYGEAGGQVGDVGVLQVVGPDGQKTDYPVLDAKRPHKGGIALLAQGDKQALPLVGSTVKAIVDRDRRQQCSVHHTATHLLHAGLREILGQHVVQAGSLVSGNRLRFDFAHPKAVTKEELRSIEDFVNDLASSHNPVVTEEMSLEQAKKTDAMMLFGEKYDDVVRVVKTEKSVELCGGTHVPNTGFVFPFKIVSESSVAAGTRRIEAVAGRAAMKWYNEREQVLEEIKEVFRGPITEPSEILENVKASVQNGKDLTKRLKDLQLKLMETHLNPICEYPGVKAYDIPHADPENSKKSFKALQKVVKGLLDKDPSAVHVIIHGDESLQICSKSDKGCDKVIQVLFEQLKQQHQLDGRFHGNGKFAQASFTSRLSPSDKEKILLEIRENCKM